LLATLGCNGDVHIKTKGMSETTHATTNLLRLEGMTRGTQQLQDLRVAMIGEATALTTLHVVQ